MKKALATASVVTTLAALPAAAEGFQIVKDQETFLSVVGGKKLTRFGVKLDVLPTGEIKGRAFGQPVTGAWQWDNGYFCRDLYFGQQDLGPNCQKVLVNGGTVRFVADRGEGQYADLTVE